jgi:hypothetical protein
MPYRFCKYSHVSFRQGLLALLFAPAFFFGQGRGAADITSPPESGFRCRTEIFEGDTFPLIDLQTVEVSTTFVFKTRRQYEQWSRTKANVKKVYPYAILAAAKLKEYDKALEKIPDPQLQKAFIRVCEKDLRNQFEEELKGLTVSQGKLLMKLIDRETQKTTYEIVKQLRGGFQAAMWQTLACLFGHNMKAEYDPLVDDVLTERAIKLVERGEF